MEDLAQRATRLVRRDVPGADPALQDRMALLLARLHSLVEELHVTTPELMAVLRFLGDVGRADELVLLSDVLGLSAHVDRLTNPCPADATPSSVEGPFYRDGAPVLEEGELARSEEPGEPLFVSGTVRAAGAGRPLAGAVIDIWQTNDRGVYSQEGPADRADFRLRGRQRTDQEGRYDFRTIRPVPYEIGWNEGPVGGLLRRLGRDRTRPAHLHFKVTAEGHRPLTTMVFFQGDRYLPVDPVFGVSDGLVVGLARHERPEELRARALDRPFSSLTFDFVLSATGQTA